MNMMQPYTHQEQTIKELYESLYLNSYDEDEVITRAVHLLNGIPNFTNIDKIDSFRLRDNVDSLNTLFNILHITYPNEHFDDFLTKYKPVVEKAAALGFGIKKSPSLIYRYIDACKDTDKIYNELFNITHATVEAYYLFYSIDPNKQNSKSVSEQYNDIKTVYVEKAKLEGIETFKAITDLYKTRVKYARLNPQQFGIFKAPLRGEQVTHNTNKSYNGNKFIQYYKSVKEIGLTQKEIKEYVYDSQKPILQKHIKSQSSAEKGLEM